MNIEPLTSTHQAAWLRMRLALWSDSTEREHLAEMQAFLRQPGRYAQFIAISDSGTALGFAEASLRTDYVNGTDSNPVAFLEGLYVEQDARCQGVARKLVAAVATWGKSLGCSELASDTQLENLASQAAHSRLGFAETGRVVYFKMVLGNENAA